MSGRVVSTPWMLITLSGMSAVGLSTLVWLAPIPSDSLTPAQQSLLNIDDWMVKASIGAILGCVGARAGLGNTNESPG